MVLTDPIADMLTRIRNAIMRKHEEVKIPHSKMKEAIAKLLLSEGFISNYEVKDVQKKKSTFKEIVIKLKYDPNTGECAIRGIERVSKPGRRIYVGVDKLPVVKNHLGIAVLTTSKGIKTNKQCKRENLGGEVICYIW